MASMNPKISELVDQVEQLNNPSDRPPASTPAANVQIIDRAALLKAWEANIATQKGVIAQLEAAQRSDRMTRLLVIGATVVNIALFIYVFKQVERIGDMIHVMP